MIRLEPRLDEQHHRHLRRKCHWMALTRVLYSGPSPKKVLPTLDNIRTELKQSIGYTGSKGQLRKDLLYTKSAHTRCGVNQKSADGETRCSSQQDQIPSHGQGVERGGLHR